MSIWIKSSVSIEWETYNDFYILWWLLLSPQKITWWTWIGNFGPDIANQDNVNFFINRFSNLSCLHCHFGLLFQIKTLHFLVGLPNVSSITPWPLAFLLHSNFGRDLFGRGCFPIYLPICPLPTSELLINLPISGNPHLCTISLWFLNLFTSQNYFTRNPKIFSNLKIVNLCLKLWFLFLFSYLKFGVVVWNCVCIFVARRSQVLVQSKNLFQLNLKRKNPLLKVSACFKDIFSFSSLE